MASVKEKSVFLPKDHSADRLRYWVQEKPSLDTEIYSTLKQLLADFELSERTRLDYRCVFQGDMGELRLLLAALQSLDDDLEIGLHPGIDGVYHLHICLNEIRRRVNPLLIENIQQNTQAKVSEYSAKLELSGGFESYALGQLSDENLNGDRIVQHGKNGFDLDVDQVHSIWGPAHKLDKADVQGILDNPDDYWVYARMRNNEAIALGLIDASESRADGSWIGESTEWAVSLDTRGRGLIGPVLIAMHGHSVDSGGIIYAHLRTAIKPRSVSPAVRSGMKVDIPGEFDPRVNRKWILTNHVPLAADEPTDNYGGENGDFSDYRHFVLGSIDRGLFSDNLKSKILEVLSLKY